MCIKKLTLKHVFLLIAVFEYNVTGKSVSQKKNFEEFSDSYDAGIHIFINFSNVLSRHTVEKSTCYKKKFEQSFLEGLNISHQTNKLICPANKLPIYSSILNSDLLEYYYLWDITFYLTKKCILTKTFLFVLCKKSNIYKMGYGYN